MGQPWISNCICLIYQARSNNENPNKLKGKGRESHGITYSSAADSRRLLMERGGKQKEVWDFVAWCGCERAGEEEREKEIERKKGSGGESSEWCSDSRVHIWINASTKGNFLLTGSSSPPQVARWGLSLTEDERHRCREPESADFMFLFSYSALHGSCLAGSLGWLGE